MYANHIKLLSISGINITQLIIFHTLLIATIIVTLFFLKNRKKNKFLTQLAEITEKAWDAIIVCEYGKIVYVNSQVRKLIEYEHKELINKNIFEIIPELEISDKQIQYSDTTIITKYGKKIPVQIIVRRKISNPDILEILIRDISDYQNLLKDLKRSERLFKALVETSPDGLIIFDEKYTITYVSPSTVGMFGYDTQNEIIGKKILDLIDKESRINFATNVQVLISGKPVGEAEYVAEHKDGSKFYISVSGNIIKLSEDTSLAIFITIRDISERKLIERALRDRENRFIKLFEHAKDCMLIEDSKGIIIRANKAAEEIFGCPKNEIIGKKITDFQTIDDKNSPEYSYDAKNISENVEIDIIRKDNKRITAQISISEFNSNGETHKLLIIRDITSQKHAEDIIRQSSERYRKLAELLPALVFEIDRDGNMHFVNGFFKKMLAYKNKNDIPSLFEIVVPTDKEKLESYLHRIQYTNDHFENEFYIKRRTGEIIPVKLYATPINTPNLPHGFNCIMIDISDIKEYEKSLKKKNEELEALIRTKDLLLSIIGHDLRGPIGNLKSMLEMLNDSPEDFSEIEKSFIIKELFIAASKTYDLLENLLYWAKSQRGEIEYNPERLNIRKIIESTILLHQSIAGSKKINIKYENPQDVFVYADRNMVNAVLRNLISNALKFTNEGGKIVIYTEIIDKYVKISVQDDGVGIEKEEIGKIFDAKFTTKGTRNEVGTGLGLLLCKEFVERNSGQITVESEKGKGAVFSFTLPLVK